VRGLYEDPGGGSKLRYWDGIQLSPLLPSDVVKPKGEKVRPSARSWSELPMVGRHWSFAAGRVRRFTVELAVAGPLAAALLAAGLAIELWWDRGTQHKHARGIPWLCGGLYVAMYAYAAWTRRRQFRKD
jgi:hypothetical protein